MPKVKVDRLQSRVRKNRFFCDHCKEYLSEDVFKKHRRKYFSKVTKTWASHVHESLSKLGLSPVDPSSDSSTDEDEAASSPDTGKY